MSQEQIADNSAPMEMDISLSEIVTVRQRSIGERAYKKLKANISTIGLIDPLCVCEDSGTYYLLDGYFRMKVLEELGETEAPCLILSRKDVYTPNKQVNNLSRIEQNRMMRKALEKLDERTIAESFGLKSLDLKSDYFLKDLHSSVIKAIDAGNMSKHNAREFVFVTQERQADIIKLMQSTKDYSSTFLKTQILRTAQQQRIKQRGRKSPWERASYKNQDLSKRLSEANLNYAFYQAQYHRYSADLMKLVIYIRRILNTSALSAWIRKNDAETYNFFKELLHDNMINGSMPDNIGDKA